MGTITVADGTEIFYKDWGSGQPIVFVTVGRSRLTTGTPRCCSSCSTVFRVVAHDRRGHGRCSQTGDGYDMDHYADDLAALTTHLDLTDAVHVGHSPEAARWSAIWPATARAEWRRRRIASAVPPLMVHTDANPGGLPKKVFDDFQRSSLQSIVVLP